LTAPRNQQLKTVPQESFNDPDSKFSATAFERKTMSRRPTSPVVDIIEQSGCKIFVLNRPSRLTPQPDTQTSGVLETKLPVDDIGRLYQTMRELAATRAALSRLNREAAYLRNRLNAFQA
jgi:hypothetical protein